MPLLAYLDQTHIGTMSDAQFEELSALVDGEVVVLPVSDIHLVETIKQRAQYRPETLRRFAALRRDNVLMPEATVLALEWIASQGLVRVRDVIVGQSPGLGVFWDGAAADALPLAAEVLDDDAGSSLATSAKESFGAAAANLAALKAVPLEHVREQIVAAMRMLKVTPAPELDDLPATEEDFAAMFPSIGLRRAFYSHATVLEPNDIADLSFIVRTVPHFDVVAVDRKMHDRLQGLRRQLPPDWSRRLFRAKVVRSVDGLLEALRVEK